jgi:hypothetical protein
MYTTSMYGKVNMKLLTLYNSIDSNENCKDEETHLMINSANQAWYHTTVIPALRHEDCELEAYLGYIVRCCLTRKRKK